ncbi:hypothetical protein ACFVRB_43235 [Streptomyces nojiriensis]|uniref:hypothetical protein n=1 Tax=Streptomyces nojiriensis TaxID=66374 RepID=UPI0036DBBA0C
MPVPRLSGTPLPGIGVRCDPTAREHRRIAGEAPVPVAPPAEAAGRRAPTVTVDA